MRAPCTHMANMRDDRCNPLHTSITSNPPDLRGIRVGREVPHDELPTRGEAVLEPERRSVAVDLRVTLRAIRKWIPARTLRRRVRPLRALPIANVAAWHQAHTCRRRDTHQRRDLHTAWRTCLPQHRRRCLRWSTEAWRRRLGRQRDRREERASRRWHPRCWPQRTWHHWRVAARRNKAWRRWRRLPALACPGAAS